MKISELISNIANEYYVPIIKIKVGKKHKQFRYSYSQKKFICVTNANITMYLNTILKKYNNNLSAKIEIVFDKEDEKMVNTLANITTKYIERKLEVNK